MFEIYPTSKTEELIIKKVSKSFLKLKLGNLLMKAMITFYKKK